MYEELIKALRHCANSSCEHCAYLKQDENCFVKFCGILKEAADAIEDLENKLNLWRQDKISRWIPVTERLPEEHIFVLIRQDDNRIMIAERVDGDWWYRYFAYDVDRWDENEQGTITHWMPLPEPPKEET